MVKHFFQPRQPHARFIGRFDLQTTPKQGIRTGISNQPKDLRVGGKGMTHDETIETGGPAA
jgi:hypothetical protein